MTADIELLPLPRTLQHADDADLATHVQDYARANVAHATAAKDAEIEALRAEVAAWRELSDHVRAGACNAIWPDRYTDARTSDVAAALKRAERLAEALRGLLALPIAEAELRHLDKGIGTATRNAAWLRARAALRDHDQEGKDG